MKVGKPHLRHGWLISLLPGFLLLAACNSQSNINSKVGPSVQFKITNLNGLWPVSTGKNPGSETGFAGVPTPQPVQTLTAFGTPKSEGSKAPYFDIDPQNPAPNFDANVGLVPGDASGVTRFDVHVQLTITCNGATPSTSINVGNSTLGSVGGPALTNPFYLQELSTALIQKQGCGGQNVPSPGTGTYQFSVDSTNGKGISSSYVFFVQAGTAPIGNAGQ